MTGWIVSTLIASSALMLLVLAVRRPVAKHFGARAAYALWLLPALRMVLPPLPEAVTAVAPALPANLDIAALIAAGPLPAPAPEAAFDWMVPLAILWLAVAVLRFVTPFAAYRRFMRHALEQARLLSREGGVAVHLSRRLAGPLAAGVFARRIVLPHDFHQRFDEDEQRLALAHEAAHHARGDTLANAVALAVLALHWWNPVAHFAWRAFRADQELACDALVLRGRSAEERHAYGSALVKAAFGGTPAAACGLGRAAELKDRLRALRGGDGRPKLGAAMAAALVVGGLAGTATGSAAAEKVRDFGEQVREALPVAMPAAVAMPAPPAPPAAPRPPRAVRATQPSRVEIDGVRYVPVVPARADGSTYVPAPPVPPVPPLPPVSRLVPAPVPPIPPVPPMPPLPRGLSMDAREAIREQAMAAREQAYAARERADAVREAAREAARTMRERAYAAREDAREAERAARERAYAAREKARDCARRGAKLSAATRDWGSLAGCDGALEREMQRAMAEAQREIARGQQLAAAEQRRAMAALEREMARMGAQ